MCEQLLEMKLSRFKELIDDNDDSKNFVAMLERTLNGTGTENDSPYIYIGNQFYKIVY